MVNKSVDPCDDFYRHVCGVNAEGDLRTLTEDVEKIEFMNSTVFDDVSEYMVEIIQCTDEPYTGESISDKLKEQFNKACQNGQQEIFLKSIETIFNITIDGTTLSCTQYEEEIDTISKRVNDIFIEEYQKECTLVLPARHYQLWMYRNPEAINRLTTLFENTKKTYYEWVENTPWINNRHLKDNYVHLLNVTYFWHSGEFKIDMKTFTNLYSDCKKSVSMWLKDPEVIKKICVRETFKINTNEKKPEWSIDNPSIYYAKSSKRDGYRTIVFYLRRYILSALIKSEVLFFGVDGFSMGHEMAHSIITSDELYFTKNGTSCVQKQIDRTCKFFDEEECVMNRTILEDGPDFLGSQVILELLIKQMGLEFFEISEEYGNIPNNQLYFYGQAATLCWHRSEKSGTGNYSPFQVRFNAITAQHSEFQKAFQCSPESKMMRSAAEKCYILGKDAPDN